MGSLTQSSSFDVNKVAIIGAGPTGIAAAKYLIAQGICDITIFEQQDHVSGIWHYYGLAAGTCPVPQQDPHHPPDTPLQWDSTSAPIFISPMYENLHANIPKEVMQFSDQPFPENAKLFPERPMIEDYLVKYSEDVKPLIRFCQRVERVSLKRQDDRDKWEVETKSTMTGNDTARQVFDAVVVANGHYSTPFMPDMRNMKECRKPAFLSVRHPTPPGRLHHCGCEEMAEIEEFLVEEKGVLFRDGRIERDVDAVVFCTGFLYSYPFLRDLDHKLITTGRGVHGLYQHVFDIRHPTLVFPGLNMKAAPWPLAESQAALFAAVWSNDIKLPSQEFMEAWSTELEKQKGEAFHTFGPNGDGLYINRLHDLAMTAKRPGKEPPHWDHELMWQRSVFLDAKVKFEQLGCKARTMEEVGFYYKPDNTQTSTV
ncbi:hypothetical protein EDB82DRAFT_505534 [Fusarium venenatum]|uniref:uncharacterized protein n=1 Tax=Fusarium venenatum TaxID=56646 RepID=UPI001DBAF3B7|nr:hypothetical protein EDB82DRAFT_505534 [Fusarium venenatum]